jgi:hypothetical protein
MEKSRHPLIMAFPVTVPRNEVDWIAKMAFQEAIHLPQNLVSKWIYTFKLDLHGYFDMKMESMDQLKERLKQAWYFVDSGEEHFKDNMPAYEARLPDYIDHIAIRFRALCPRGAGEAIKQFYAEWLSDPSPELKDEVRILFYDVGPIKGRTGTLEHYRGEPAEFQSGYFLFDHGSKWMVKVNRHNWRDTHILMDVEDAADLLYRNTVDFNDGKSVFVKKTNDSGVPIPALAKIFDRHGVEPFGPLNYEKDLLRTVGHAFYPPLYGSPSLHLWAHCCDLDRWFGHAQLQEEEQQE